MLYCRLYNLVDEFRSQDFGLKLNWEAPWDRTWCILFCLQNADKTRVDKVRYWTAVARLFRGIDLCRSESMEEAGSMEEADLVMRIPVTTY
jgi:hypothetical protein